MSHQQHKVNTLTSPYIPLQSFTFRCIPHNLLEIKLLYSLSFPCHLSLSLAFPITSLQSIYCILIHSFAIFHFPLHSPSPPCNQSIAFSFIPLPSFTFPCIPHHLLAINLLHSLSFPCHLSLSLAFPITSLQAIYCTLFHSLAIYYFSMQSTFKCSFIRSQSLTFPYIFPYSYAIVNIAMSPTPSITSK